MCHSTASNKLKVDERKVGRTSLSILTYALK